MPNKNNGDISGNSQENSENEAPSAETQAENASPIKTGSAFNEVSVAKNEKNPTEEIFGRGEYGIASDENMEEKNIADGNQAIETLLENAANSENPDTLVYKNAMYRSDIGYIDFVWGKPGDGKKFKRGYGLSHIIAKRNSENGRGLETAKKLVEVIAKATKIIEQSVSSEPGNNRIRLIYGDYVAVLSEKAEGNHWLLTGWEIEKETVASANGEVRDSSAATTVTPTLTRRNGDGTVSNNSIHPDGETVNNNLSGEGGDYSANSNKTNESDSVNGRISILKTNTERRHTTLKEQEYIRSICRALGREVVFENIPEVLKIQGIEVDSNNIPDGYIDENNVIHIGYTVYNPVQFILKHELTHFGEGTEAYTAFIEAVQTSKAYLNWPQKKTGSASNSLGKLEGLYREAVIKSREKTAPIGAAKAQAEMFADFCGDVMFTERGLKSLAKAVEAKHRPKVIQFVLDFFVYLKQKLSGNKQFTMEIARLESKYADMLRSANETATDNNGEVRYSMGREENDINSSNDNNLVRKITINMTEKERYEILKNKKITLTQVNVSNYESAVKNYPDLLNKKLKKTQARKLLKKVGEEFDIYGSYDSEDIELSFEFGKNNLDESANKQKGNYDICTQMLSCFSDVISNAVGVEIHNRNEEGYKPDRTLKYVYVLCSVFENATDIVPVKLEIKEFFDKPNRLYVAVALESIEKDRVVSMGVPNNRSHVRTSPVNISISKIFENVNIKDANFLKYIPDEFLSSEQISAKKIALKKEKNSRLQKLNKKFSIPTDTSALLERYENGEIEREEYVEKLEELWGKAIERYGSIEQGEKAKAPISVPSQVVDNKNTERFIRTIIEKGETSVNDYSWVNELQFNTDSLNTAQAIILVMQKTKANSESVNILLSLLNNNSSQQGNLSLQSNVSNDIIN